MDILHVVDEMDIGGEVVDIDREKASFQIWAQVNLPAGSNAFDGDSDADGIPNSIEYIFGDREIISPAPGQLSAPPQPVPSDVTLSLEVSDDLQIWTEILRYESGKLVRQLADVRVDDDIVTDERDSAQFPAARYYRYRASQ